MSGQLSAGWDVVDTATAAERLTGAPSGFRTPDPLIKSSACTTSNLLFLQVGIVGSTLRHPAAQRVCHQCLSPPLSPVVGRLPGVAKKRGAGDGALYRRKDGMWVGRVDVPPGPDGKRKVRSVYSKDRAACAEKLRTLQAEVDAGLVTTGPTTTVAEWLDYWLDEVHRDNIRPGTRTDYRRIIKNHIVPRIGSKKLKELKSEDVLAMQKHISKTTTRTAQVAHHILNRAMNDAVAYRRCTFNPVGVVATPKHVKVEREPFTMDETRAIIAAAANDDAEGAGPVLASRWVAAFMTGGRKGELTGLTWDRVDLDAGTIDLAWQLQQLPWRHGCGGTCGKKRAAYCPEKERDVAPGDEYRECHRGLCWTRPKSDAGIRLVPIVGDMPLKLTEHRQQTADQPNPHGLVWHHRDGRPLSAKDDFDLWQALLVVAGVRTSDDPPIPHHRCRNTTATLLLAAGVDAHVVDSVLGHSDVAVTRGYQHVDLGLARAGFDKALSGLLAR